MSKHLESNHGTIKSYVIGYLLSLLLTFIPYNLVVNEMLKGTALLVAILFIAMLQLIVQIVFFLHLGRGPKPDWNLYFFISTFSLILVVVGGSMFIINNITYNMLPSDQVKRLVNGEGISQIEGSETGACYGQFEKYMITIKDNMPDTAVVNANECDTIFFVNEDAETHQIVFGTYPIREVYAGIDVLEVKKGRSKNIKLSEPGTYYYYDALNPELRGSFNVAPESNQ
jgi:cytochrome o ubiquinol oxidase operon protein cyoD